MKYLRRYNRCVMYGTCIENQAVFSRNDRDYPCFQKAFRFMDNNSKKTYKISYKLFIRKKCSFPQNNFAVIKKSAMRRMLSCMKLLIPFTYHFEEDNTYFYLNMDLTGTALQHKALLMLSRSLFEFPHNMCLSDALYIRDLGKLGDIDIRHYNLINLYLICLASNNFSVDESIISRHDISLLSFDKLKKKLKDKRRVIISRVIPYRKEYIGLKIIWNPGEDLVDVFSPESINSRLETYAKNLERILNV